MTSDAQEKLMPYFIRARVPHYRGGLWGCAVIISTWVILYLWGVTQLVDGILDWLSYGRSSAVIRVAVAVATTTVSTVAGLLGVFAILLNFQLMRAFQMRRSSSDR